MEEIWKDVQGYEGRYQVSNFGRVRSVSRYVRKLTRNGKEGVRYLTGRILRPGGSKSGHVSVAIGKHNSRPVHQLVAEAFLGIRPPAHEVLHLNHTPEDNRVENLRWGTRSENLKMDYEVGTRRIHPNCHRRKATP